MACKPILIIEDEPDLRETLRDVLEMEGFHVATAANGLEGITLIQELGSPCLILLDLMMPVMDGWQFLDTFGARCETPAPVAVVSAAADIADVERRYGCMALKKPVRLEQLLTLAHTHCEACG